MIRFFSHWVRWRPLAQALLDSSFVIVGIVIALMWNRHGLPIDHRQVILFSLILIASAMSISALLSMYQRIHRRMIIDARSAGTFIRVFFISDCLRDICFPASSTCQPGTGSAFRNVCGIRHTGLPRQRIESGNIRTRQTSDPDIRHWRQGP